jgi:XTP/dITP diphosphohydrolase
VAGSDGGPGGLADGPSLLEFLAVMRRLRAECPWKASQTHRSLARYLLEETHETLEAIDTGAETGDWAHLREELGDLLLQVYFHAVIAEESGEFTIDDVAGDIVAKMVRRNPHVFGPAGSAASGPTASSRELSAAEVNEAWEAAKAGEKQRSSVTEGIAPTLPALLLADKVLDRLDRRDQASGQPSRGGSATESSGQTVADAPPDPTHIGDRLLDLVAEARTAGVDPEQALRDAVRRLVAARQR